LFCGLIFFKHKSEGDFMKKFWMLILAAVFAMNSGVASVFAQEETLSAISALTETAEPTEEEALFAEETAWEEDAVVSALAEEAFEDEFSDDFAMEMDTPEGAIEDRIVGGMPSDQQAY